MARSHQGITQHLTAPSQISFLEISRRRMGIQTMSMAQALPQSPTCQCCLYQRKCSHQRHDGALINTDSKLLSQYTASGSGGPIPVTALGQEYTYTTTIPGTTVPPSTIPAETLTPSVLSGSISFSATTEPASVIPGTTKMAETETITTRVAGTATSKPSTASARFSVKGYYGGPVLTAIVLSIFTIS